MGLFTRKNKNFTKEGFRMTIEDFFPIKDRGVVLTGVVECGVVELRDYVKIKGTSYRVIGIERSRELVYFANAGECIGLLVQVDPSTQFQKGSVIKGQ